MNRCYNCGKDMYDCTYLDTAKVAGIKFVGRYPAVTCADAMQEPEPDSEDMCDITIHGRDWARYELCIAKHLVSRRALSAKAAKFVRKAMGLKREELAAIMGVEPLDVSDLEGGITRATPATCFLLHNLVSSKLRSEEEWEALCSEMREFMTKEVPEEDDTTTVDLGIV